MVNCGCMSILSRFSMYIYIYIYIIIQTYSTYNCGKMMFEASWFRAMTQKHLLSQETWWFPRSIGIPKVWQIPCGWTINGLVLRPSCVLSFSGNCFWTECGMIWPLMHHCLSWFLDVDHNRWHRKKLGCPMFIYVLDTGYSLRYW